MGIKAYLGWENVACESRTNLMRHLLPPPSLRGLSCFTPLLLKKPVNPLGIPLSFVPSIVQSQFIDSSFYLSATCTSLILENTTSETPSCSTMTIGFKGRMDSRGFCWIATYQDEDSPDITLVDQLDPAGAICQATSQTHPA